MNNSCNFFGGGCCLCSACQAARKAMDEAEKITQEEIDGIFSEAEKLLEDIKIQKKENENDGRKEK